MTDFAKYRKAILDMDLGSRKSTYCYIKSSMRSTDLMTRLRLNTVQICGPNNYGEPIDVLYARLYGKEYYEKIELVIIYQIPREEMSALFSTKTPKGKNEMTFTEFKKNKVSFWQDMDDVRGVCELPLDNGRALRLWNRPFFLKAVTDFDKDFRKEWRNGDLEYEGNNYGDTSEFYIIGSVIRR